MRSADGLSRDEGGRPRVEGPSVSVSLCVCVFACYRVPNQVGKVRYGGTDDPRSNDRKERGKESKELRRRRRRLLLLGVHLCTEGGG